MRISQIEKAQTKTAEADVDFAAQTFAMHEYLYGCMEDMRSTWRNKWDAALAEERWDDIQKLMSAITLLLPASEQSIMVPVMLNFTPWQDHMKMYWPTVWIVDRGGNRHGHIGMLIYARSKEAALKKIPKGFELKNW